MPGRILRTTKSARGAASKATLHGHPCRRKGRAEGRAGIKGVRRAGGKSCLGEYYLNSEAAKRFKNGETSKGDNRGASLRLSGAGFLGKLQRKFTERHENWDGCLVLCGVNITGGIS